MKRYACKIILRSFLMCLILFLGWCCNTGRKHHDVQITLNGDVRYQKIDGFGVNANTASWGNSELVPALDMLIDELNAQIWRVVVETEIDWETQNDNKDPFDFNWDFYNQMYETAKFQRAWEEIEYLNKKGINDKLIISVMGGIPDWMGRIIILPEMEDEFVEMHLSFLYYATRVKNLNIGLYSPINETDLYKEEIEGPHTEPEQFVRILHKLAVRMKETGLDHIKLVLPDVADMNTSINRYLPELLKDSLLMQQVEYFGFHSYSGYYAPADSLIKSTEYAHIPLWMTEFNAWRDGLDNGITGVYNYDYASECLQYLFEFLENGATAALIWEAYDTYYEHHRAMSYWGILGLDPVSGTLSPRKHYYALSQVFRFVTPGSERILTAYPDNPELTVLAFMNSAYGNLSIIGIHKGKNEIKTEFVLENLPEIGNIEFYYTDSINNLTKKEDIHVNGKKIQVSVPADCLFTIAGIIPVQ